MASLLRGFRSRLLTSICVRSGYPASCRLSPRPIVGFQYDDETGGAAMLLNVDPLSYVSNL